MVARGQSQGIKPLSQYWQLLDYMVLSSYTVATLSVFSQSAPVSLYVTEHITDEFYSFVLL